MNIVYAILGGAVLGFIPGLLYASAVKSKSKALVADVKKELSTVHNKLYDVTGTVDTDTKLIITDVKYRIKNILAQL